MNQLDSNNIQCCAKVDADSFEEDIPFLLTQASLRACADKTPARQVYKDAANYLHLFVALLKEGGCFNNVDKNVITL